MCAWGGVVGVQETNAITSHYGGMNRGSLANNFSGLQTRL